MVESKPPRDINRRRQFFKLVDGEMTQQPAPPLPAKLPFREQRSPPVDPEKAIISQLFAPQQPEVTDNSGYIFDNNWFDRALSLLNKPLPQQKTVNSSVSAPPRIEDKQPLVRVPPESKVNLWRVRNIINNDGTELNKYWIKADKQRINLTVPEEANAYYDITWHMLTSNDLDYSMALKVYSDLVDGLMNAGYEKNLAMPTKKEVKELTSAIVTYASRAIPPVEMRVFNGDQMQRAMQNQDSEVDFVNFSVEDPLYPFMDFTVKLFSHDGRVAIQVSRMKGLEVPLEWAQLMLLDYNNPGALNSKSEMAHRLALELNKWTLKP